MFLKSFKEFKSVYGIAVMGLLIGISMMLETFTISFPMFKINFAFLSVAAIGMLFGPVVGIFGGMLSDVLGWVVHPDGPFLPLYTLVGGLQGFIYGYVLYHKNKETNFFGKKKTPEFTLKNKSEKLGGKSFVAKVIIARLLDVVVINMFINTYLNIHYGFIPYESMTFIIATRTVKNLLEFVVDVPMLLVVLPAAFVAYKTVVRKRNRQV
ncbi:MAG: folate family ECF transporter S component [Ruminococcus sp.]|jgi:ECF transporter S component (folate family)|nr:folate family ECF transporter S component [Ruminococcus sp.]